MNMKKILWMSVLMMFFALVIGLQGCATDESNTTGETGASNAPDAQEEEANAGEADGDVGSEEESIELKMTGWPAPEAFDIQMRAVEKFEEKYPHITIDNNPRPGETYAQTLFTELQGGQAPDVFYAREADMASLIDSGRIEQLNDFLESGDSYVHEDDFDEGVWGPSRRANGDIYGLSVDVNPHVMYYNIDLFEELGIKTPQEYFDEGNWNWEAFVEVTDQLTDADKHGYIQNAGYGDMVNWVFSNGGAIYDEENESIVFNEDPQALEAVEFIHDMVEKGNITFGGTLSQGQGADAMFMSGQVGLVSAGRWYTPVFHNEGDVEFDYIYWPSNTGNEMEPVSIATAYLVMNADTEYPEEVLKFLTYYVSQEGQEVRLGDVGVAVPSISGIEHVVTDDGIPEHAHYLLDAREHGYVPNLHISVPGLDSEFSDAFELMLIGEAEPEASIRQYTEVAQELIDEYLNQ